MLNKSKLANLYLKEGKSLQDIADLERCSLHRIQYWMRSYKIPIRTRSEAVYLKKNPDGDPFKVKEKLSREDLVLMGLGLGLWWGEGYKRHHGAVRVGNTDPILIKAFMRFLIEICGVEKSRLRFGIQVFGDLNPVDVKSFWRRELGVPDSQFLPKVVVTRKRGVGSYKHSAKFGVLTLYCINIKLRSVMDVLMDKYAHHSFAQ